MKDKSLTQRTDMLTELIFMYDLFLVLLYGTAVFQQVREFRSLFIIK